MDVKFLLRILCFLVAGVGLIGASLPGPVDSATAKLKVEKYLEDKQHTLAININDDHTSGSSGISLKEMGLETNSRFFWYHNSVTKDGPVSISISFGMNVLPSSTVQDFRNNLNFVSLDRVPMPGFKYPRGWTVYPRTRAVRFKDGVTIVSYQGGKLHFKVDTTFFAVYGMMVRKVNLPVDTHAPKQAYFKVRKDIHGLIDVNLPLVFN